MTTPLVIHGRLVTMDESRPLIEDGALYIGADELIAAVQKRSDPAPPGFESARRVETGGCVYPGLIDLHNHIVYNILGLWSPPGTTEPFTDRAQWPGHGDYERTISDPANALGALAGKAHLKYVETKAVVGGVTAIQGSAKMAYPTRAGLCATSRRRRSRLARKPSSSRRCRCARPPTTPRTGAHEGRQRFP